MAVWTTSWTCMVPFYHASIHYAYASWSCIVMINMAFMLKIVHPPYDAASRVFVPYCQSYISSSTNNSKKMSTFFAFIHSGSDIIIARITKCFFVTSHGGKLKLISVMGQVDQFDIFFLQRGSFHWMQALIECSRGWLQNLATLTQKTSIVDSQTPSSFSHLHFYSL